MHPPKQLFTKVVMIVLTIILTSSSVLGNGVVVAVIARFKSLRTVPNILVANLALVDLLNAVVNMPPYLIYTVVEASWFKGKVLAIMTTIFDRLFLILNLASMLAMMTNMYLAISFDLKYLAWKTIKKALVCVFLIWFVSVVLVTLFSIPLLDIDLGDAHVIEYRAEIYKQGKHFVASFMGFLIICGAVRTEMNLAPLQADTRLQSDIKATKTIAITIVAYFLCYVPGIVYAVMGLQKESQADSWFGFIAWYSICISSAVNPVVYYLRTNRFRSAFKQFLKDPLGSSEFKEKQNCRDLATDHENEVKGNVKSMAKKKDSEKAEGGYQFQVDGNETGQKYFGGQMDGVVILLTTSPEPSPCFHHKAGDCSENEEEKEQSDEACASNLQVRSSSQRKYEEPEEECDEVSKTYDVEKESREFRSKTDLLGITKMGTTEDPEEKKRVVNAYCFERESEIQGSSAKTRNAIKTFFIPNRDFLVRFGGISGEFGRAMVRILARRSLAKIPMARPKEPDMQPKRTKKFPRYDLRAFQRYYHSRTPETGLQCNRNNGGVQVICCRSVFKVFERKTQKNVICTANLTSFLARCLVWIWSATRLLGKKEVCFHMK
ncbi:hypothetical protein ACROYT_G019424 [Oculina patagonica]